MNTEEYPAKLVCLWKWCYWYEDLQAISIMNHQNQHIHLKSRKTGWFFVQENQTQRWVISLASLVQSGTFVCLPYMTYFDT